MLKELNIRNLAIIDDLTVRFENGLNVLTGETGAGKSIIVDALGLALGDRAQSDLIRTGEKEAIVQACFEFEEACQLPEIGVDLSEGIVLRRTISTAGKSRAYINDMMVTLQTLSEVGKALVDIHSQHEHQSLLASDKQRMVLDSYGGHALEIEKVRGLHAVTQALREEFNALSGKIKERAHRIDLLNYQINEIQAAGPRPGEKQSLEEERKILANLSRLKESAETAYALLYDADGSCTETLAKVISRLNDMQAVDTGIRDTLGVVESAMPLLEDAAIALRGFRDKYNVEPERLDVVEERLELLKRLEKKYGENIEAVLEYKKTASEELMTLETSDERLGMLEAELREKTAELINAALSLSDNRRKTAAKIEQQLVKNLKELAFGNAQFRVEVSRETDEAGEYRISSGGMDRIEFLFSANAGEALKPLAKIASGGELSRVMLALKSILADVDSVPVLIFDEVDAGIGGKTAEYVGAKLLRISENHQLICITHLPQIASRTGHHLKIEKTPVNNRMSVSVHELSGTERKDEIARMLSGTVTDISRRHAEELLERAG
jgi:DNA repair protein RecN (Recombination protein N)